MARNTGSDRISYLTPDEVDRFLQDVLKRVSRSFYLSLRVLPKKMRKPVGLAYLLARVADTIADHHRPTQQRQEKLDDLRFFQSQVKGPHDLPNIRSLVSRYTADSSSDESAVFYSLIDAFALLEVLDKDDQNLVREVVSTLVEGMDMDLNVFPAEDTDGLVALSTMEDLDRYTYLVAGCVGEFWTRIAVGSEISLKEWDVEKMSGLGVRFGKALQLTNVLRDIPSDLRIGRCYLPADELSVAGLTPEDLLHCANESRAKAVFIPWMEIALGHFQAAEAYLTAIPRRSVRLRLACLWPLLLGLATLVRLAESGKWLDPKSKVKVSRGSVYRMMLLSLPAVFSNRLLHSWIARLRRRAYRLM